MEVEMELWFDPAFVEEAVWLTLRQTTAFRTEWDAVYEIAGSSQMRETAFRQLTERYFHDLGLRELFVRCLNEAPLLSQRVDGVMVRRVFCRKGERVELYMRPASSKFETSSALLLDLQVARCLHPEELSAFLRHELLRVSDMLDPAFAYLPHPELGGTCELEDDLIRERFRVLWDLSIEARMRRRGWPVPLEAAERHREYEGAFASWEPAKRTEIRQRIETCEATTQRLLLDLACDWRLMQPLGKGGVICPLCHFPTRDGVCDWTGERALVTQLIRADFPSWEPSHGACTQCADLYRIRVRTTVGVPNG